MDKKKKKALAAKGWKIGTVQELFDLSDEEMVEIEERVERMKALRKQRIAERKLS